MSSSHKKVIIIFVVCVVLVTGLYIFFERQNKPNPVVAGNEITNKIINPMADQDTDKDTLKDWEESLWGTDPKNADTDTDGTGDGAEIAVGRNPKIAGPDDKLEMENVPLTNDNPAADTTKTNQVAKQFITEYMNMKKSGVPLTASEQSQLINGLLTSMQNGQKTLENKYTLSDIKKDPDNSIENITKYGNTMGDIMVKNTPKNTESELLILQKALTSRNQEDLDKIMILAAAYQNTVNDSLKIAVPEEVAPLELNLINSMYQVAEGIKGLQIALKDPISGVLNLSQYQNAVRGMRAAFAQINAYFENKGVVYETSQGGYTFTHIAQ